MGAYRYGGWTDQHKAHLHRKRDAEILRGEQHWRGAMYLLGYAVECKLKAKLMEKYDARTLDELERQLAKRFGRENVNLKTHSIECLFSFSDARDRLIDARGGTTNQRALAVCSSWKTEWRYSPDNASEDKCTAFFDAVETFLLFVSHNV
jgi:hypothetical protein